MADKFMMCGICETSPVQMHCYSCTINTCHDCVIKHMSADTEIYHYIVMFERRKTKSIFPYCKIHKEQICETKCQQCDIPVCGQCLCSGVHRKHDICVLLELFSFQKNTIKEKTKELETSVYPIYAEAVSEIKILLKTLPQTYERMMSEIDHQGEEWHREVDVIINRQKQEVQNMKTDDLATLKKLLEEMENLLCTLRQAIMENNDILQSADVTKVLDSKYTSPEMWDPPPSIYVTLPTFTPLPIQGEQLHQMFGALTAASMPHSLSSIKLIEDKLDTDVKELKLLDTIKSLSSTHTRYEYLYNITCQSPGQVWVSGGDESKIKRFAMTGSLQQMVITKTGHMPSSITVTTQGDLIYADDSDRSIYRVRHEKIISLEQGWYPDSVCTTASDDLLITMTKSATSSRVVRYSGSTEKQVIQFDDQGEPLFSSDYMFIAENSNKDMICVSDTGTNTVVVLNQAGKLRFRYTGNLSSQKYESFFPRGVVIDSMGHILVADCHNNCIHILDQHGHFIRYIDNSKLKEPWGLSLDRNNTLYVAECNLAKIRKIKYLT